MQLFCDSNTRKQRYLSSIETRMSKVGNENLVKRDQRDPWRIMHFRKWKNEVQRESDFKSRSDLSYWAVMDSMEDSGFDSDQKSMQNGASDTQVSNIWFIYSIVWTIFCVDFSRYHSRRVMFEWSFLTDFKWVQTVK